MTTGAPSDPRTFASAHRRAHQGDDLGRILALSDGVFGFALTLLALSLVVPSAACPGAADASCTGALADALRGEWISFLNYFLTFIIIGWFWITHHRNFRYIARYDGTLQGLNLAFLSMVAIAPFVLGVLNAYPQVPWAIALFSIEQTAATLLLAAIWVHADRAGLLSEAADPAVVAYVRLRAAIVAVAFGLAIPIAFLNVPLAEVLWIAGFAAVSLARRFGAAKDPTAGP